MLERVQKILQQSCGLSIQQKIVVGVSGGADSLCLLDLLVRLDYPIVVAHFNHLLRPEASDDARAVELIAAQRGLPFALGAASTLDYAQEHKYSVEEAARELRYRFIFGQAQKQNAQAVVVAHTADDQVETVLMHLLRGTGLDGLTGMPVRALPNPWSESIPLVRPLLDVWRAEIEVYCSDHNLFPLVDATNADTTYFRNRLRHELIPVLETYNPGLRTRLHQTSDLLAADRQLLDDLTEKSWPEIALECSSDYVVLDHETFDSQPLGLRRRLVRKAITHLCFGTRDVDFAMVQRALDFAENPTITGQADLGLGLRISGEGARLIISEWQSELPVNHWPQVSDACELAIPGELDLGNGWILRAETSSDVDAARKKAEGNVEPYQAWSDLRKKQPSLVVRPRRPGDRFQPLGMEGKSMKISDYMINEKVPQRARAGWPLICAGDEIVWLPGYQLAHPFRITRQSRQIVRLILLQTG